MSEFFWRWFSRYMKWFSRYMGSWARVKFLFFFGLFGVVFLASAIEIFIVLADPGNAARGWILGVGIIGFVLFVLNIFVPKFINKSDPRRASRTRSSDVVSENYLSKTGFREMAANVMFVSLAILSALHGQADFLIVSFAAMSLIFCHSFVTSFRVSHGYFGDNGDEVAELIQFIAAETNKSGRPPGTRISQDASQPTTRAVSGTEEAAHGAAA